MGKNKLLVLDLVGDGNLPFVSVLRPMVRNRRGQPVLQFKRQLVGRGQTLPLVIKNDGNVPAKVGPAYSVNAGDVLQALLMSSIRIIADFNGISVKVCKILMV